MYLSKYEDTEYFSCKIQFWTIIVCCVLKNILFINNSKINICPAEYRKYFKNCNYNGENVYEAIWSNWQMKLLSFNRRRTKKTTFIYMVCLWLLMFRRNHFITYVSICKSRFKISGLFEVFSISFKSMPWCAISFIIIIPRLAHLYTKSRH